MRVRMHPVDMDGARTDRKATGDVVRQYLHGEEQRIEQQEQNSGRSPGGKRRSAQPPPPAPCAVPQSTPRPSGCLPSRRSEPSPRRSSWSWRSASAFLSHLAVGKLSPRADEPRSAPQRAQSLAELSPRASRRSPPRRLSRRLLPEARSLSWDMSHGRRAAPLLQPAAPQWLCRVEGGETPRGYAKTALGQQIGKGASARVFRGTCGGEAVAVKVMPLRRERALVMKREVLLMRMCTSAHIVSFLDAFLAPDARGHPSLWLVMELCERGSALDVMVRRRGPLDEAEVLAVANCVLLALEHIHTALRVCHRDVKAANVLLADDGAIKLSDFSAAAEPPGQLVGTPHWMAPELLALPSDGCGAALASRLYDAKVDIWSLGITLIELAETKPPLHHIDSTLTLLLMIAHLPPPKLKPSTRASSALRQLVDAMLVKSAADRPSATQLLEGIDAPPRHAIAKAHSWPRASRAHLPPAAQRASTVETFSADAPPLLVLPPLPPAPPLPPLPPLAAPSEAPPPPVKEPPPAAERRADSFLLSWWNDLVDTFNSPL
ncbi:hypothetical protein AB1Y20_013775 [Prymnesium parvum]|uniref:non-specific serine/threonine protein kinase n=1 Tax=Prymnesium parvum TaxID=97485 RepID=A0AB34IEI9_PRYPA